MKLSSPLVTIAIPVYKAKYLRCSIESALEQTYSNTELVIVNDNSPETEAITSIIESFNDNRIRYYINETNLGSQDPANNWNRCLSYAEGEFFCILCDDDFYKPTFIEEMLELVNQFPDCNVFRARCCIIDQSGTSSDLYPSSPLWESAEDYMLHVFKDLRRQSISEFLLRTQHIRNMGGYTLLPLAWQADYVSIISFGLYGGIASTNHILVSFRMSGHNISSKSSVNGMKKIEANLFAYRKFKDIIENTSNNAFRPYLNSTIKIWKYRADSVILGYAGFKQKIEMLLKMRKYDISTKAILKGLLLSIV